jgi:hypothetical protein
MQQSLYLCYNIYDYKLAHSIMSNLLKESYDR